MKLQTTGTKTRYTVTVRRNGELVFACDITAVAENHFDYSGGFQRYIYGNRCKNFQRIIDALVEQGRVLEDGDRIDVFTVPDARIAVDGKGKLKWVEPF